MRVVILISALFLAPFAVPLRAQGDQLDTDIRLFTVLAAINVAGYDAGYGSPSDSPLRREIREALADFDGSSRDLLRNYYRQHEQQDAGATLAQYVSFALMNDGPPEFAIKAASPMDLPPDVRRLRGLSRILAEFYQQAGIEKLWEQHRPAFDREIARYQDPLIEALFEAGGYLRFSPTSREVQRFKVFFDLLGAPNNINTRGYKGIVYVVAHPSKEPRIDEIRHAFLLHLLDPLSVRYAKELSKKEVLARFALFAPALGEIYKTDFQLLTTKCLVKAVEAKLARIPEAERLARVNQDLREGFILTPYFYESLTGYENQGQEMKRYYKEMIAGVNLKREAARLQDVHFAEAPATPDEAPRAARPILSEAEMLLREADFLLRDQQLKQAGVKFREALDDFGGRNADASFGLARVAVSQGQADLARNYFLQAIDADPDPYVQSMSHVYLGRIEDLMGNREQAVEHYRLALAVDGATERTREFAEKGLEEPFAPPGR